MEKKAKRLTVNGVKVDGEIKGEKIKNGLK